MTDARRFIESLKADRLSWIEATRKNNFEKGIQKLLTELYPDKAHFIFELLQNAEDAEATKIHFLLTKEMLTVTHNGKRIFDEKDVKSITNIGDSTKKDDLNQIGKFGVGFKAVFSYTATPRVLSRNFCFEIRDLVCPYPLEHSSAKPEETCFEFPFNHTQKTAKQAFSEISNGLTGLKDNVLLFLSNIEHISWDIVGTGKGIITRLSYFNNIIKIEHSDSKASSYWLRFTRPTKDGSKFVAVVFRLMFKKEGLLFYDDKVKIKDQFRIAPTDGQLSIFFPAEKETTKLRFHIHGPYASTVARDSIPYDNPDNVGLLEDTGNLLADTLPEIKKLGLLDIDFLGVLPNDRDELDAFYKPLQTMAIQTMRQKPLVPTNKGGFAPANELLQGPKEIKDVIGDEELPFFVGKERRWAKGAGQKNSDADLFIKSLGIESWGWNELVGKVTGLYNRYQNDISLKRNIEWLVNQNDDWMQRFYALLFDAITDNRKEINPSIGSNLISSLSQCAIVRTQKGEHLIGIGVYFPLDATGSDIDGLERVKADILTGKNKGRVEKAKSFLERAGVKQAGEREEIESILKRFYTKESERPSEKLHLQHIRRFIECWLKEKSTDIFAGYYIFNGSSGESAYCPKNIYLDKPYTDTGLSALFENSDCKMYGLWDGYLKLKNPSFVKFAVAAGVMAGLKINKSDEIPREHPDYKYLKWTNFGNKRRDYEGEVDYYIEDLDFYLLKNSPKVSLLIWKTMCEANKQCLYAKYWPNSSVISDPKPSSLVYCLKDAEWIPGKDGNFYKPADISEDMLVDGFTYDFRYDWLREIGFGANFKKQQENYKQKQEWAKQLGFPFDFIEKLEGIPVGKMEQLFGKFNAAMQDVLTTPEDASFPSSRTPGPEHRKEKARDQAIKADDKVYEERTRTVRTSANANNPEAKEYLRNIYQNEDGDIICQLCHEKMPFQLDGIDYFEKQPFIRNTAKEHKANNLALCPNCSAEFWYACATDEEEKKGLVIDLDERLPDDELWIELDMPVHKELWFTQRHLIDLKEALLTEDGAEAEDTDFDEQEAEGNEEPAQPHKPLPIPNGKVDKFTDSKGREVLIIRDPIKQTAPATSAKSSLLKCPYCDYSIRQEKYQTHIKDKCPKRPAITGLSHTTQQPLRSAIPRCRFCDSPAIAGSDVCYSCGG